MNTNMLSKSMLTIIIATAVALATVSFVLSSKVSQPYPDYAQRHLNEAARPADTTDYAQRQSEISVPVKAPLAASDYFMRHPELKVSPQASGDLTDYFFRQAGMPAGPAVDLTDYFFRHR